MKILFDEYILLHPNHIVFDETLPLVMPSCDSSMVLWPLSYCAFPLGATHADDNPHFNMFSSRDVIDHLSVVILTDLSLLVRQYGKALSDSPRLHPLVSPISICLVMWRPGGIFTVATAYRRHRSKEVVTTTSAHTSRSMNLGKIEHATRLYLQKPTTSFLSSDPRSRQVKCILSGEIILRPR